MGGLSSGNTVFSHQHPFSMAHRVCKLNSDFIVVARSNLLVFGAYFFRWLRVLLSPLAVCLSTQHFGIRIRSLMQITPGDSFAAKYLYLICSFTFFFLLRSRFICRSLFDRRCMEYVKGLLSIFSAFGSNMGSAFFVML